MEMKNGGIAPNVQERTPARRTGGVGRAALPLDCGAGRSGARPYLKILRSND
jgi:hypothetical protein